MTESHDQWAWTDVVSDPSDYDRGWRDGEAAEASRHSAELGEALTGMERCIAALAIELPEAVWADVVNRWRRFRDAVNWDDRGERCPEVWQDESQVCQCWKSLGHDESHSFDE